MGMEKTAGGYCANFSSCGKKFSYLIGDHPKDNPDDIDKESIVELFDRRKFEDSFPSYRFLKRRNFIESTGQQVPSYKDYLSNFENIVISDDEDTAKALQALVIFNSKNGTCGNHEVQEKLYEKIGQINKLLNSTGEKLNLSAKTDFENISLVFSQQSDEDISVEIPLGKYIIDGDFDSKINTLPSIVKAKEAVKNTP